MTPDFHKYLLYVLVSGEYLRDNPDDEATKDLFLWTCKKVQEQADLEFCLKQTENPPVQ